MANKCVLVVGASGFIGRHAVSALVRAGFKVRAAVRRPIPFSKSVDIAVIPDFVNQIRWDSILHGVDIIVHAAGLAHVDRDDEAYAVFDRVNRAATDELARAARNANIERFLHISTVRAQVGTSAPHVVREQDVPNPTDHYGRSKLSAELAVRTAGMPFTILRPVAVYGPNTKGNIQSLVRLASLPFPLPFAALRNRRSLLGIDNLISAILFVIKNEATIGETYLVADQTPLEVADIVVLLRKAMGRRPGLINVSPDLLRFALHVVNRDLHWERLGKDLIVETSKLQSLGWRPEIDTYDGFVAMLYPQQTLDAPAD